MNSTLCLCIEKSKLKRITDLKTLNQLLNKFRKVVAERREEYYLEISEKKAQELRGERLQKIWGKMKRDRVIPEDLIDR